jgi:hypothetical protein
MVAVLGVRVCIVWGRWDAVCALCTFARKTRILATCCDFFSSLHSWAVMRERDCVTAPCKVVFFFWVAFLTCASQSQFHYNVCYDPNGTEQDALSLNKLHISTEVAWKGLNLVTGNILVYTKNVYLPSLRMKVPDHVYVFGSLLLQ